MSFTYPFSFLLMLLRDKIIEASLNFFLLILLFAIGYFYLSWTCHLGSQGYARGYCM